MNTTGDAAESLHKAFGTPADTWVLYGRLWQFETWLRQMVYVELNAALGETWRTVFPEADPATSRIEEALEKEKSFRHMETPQTNPLSYATMAQLWQIIFRRDLWRYFEGYFPPRDILEAKRKELMQIRNRVAHFRHPHRDDLRRVEQFLRDVDDGFHSFFSSYARDRISLFLAKDTRPAIVFAGLADSPFRLNPDPFPERVPLEDKGSITFYQCIRPWAGFHKLLEATAPAAGMLYALVFQLDGSQIDFRKLLEETKAVHKYCMLISISGACRDTVEITFPSLMNLEGIRASVDAFQRALRSHSSKLENGGFFRPRRDSELDKVALEWPEFVLPPSNPLNPFYWSPGETEKPSPHFFRRE